MGEQLKREVGYKNVQKIIFLFKREKLAGICMLTGNPRMGVVVVENWLSVCCEFG